MRLESGGKQSGKSRLGQTTDNVKYQMGDLNVQLKDCSKNVMVTVFHDQAGSCTQAGWKGERLQV